MNSGTSVVLKQRNTLDDLAVGQSAVRDFLDRHGVSARTQFNVDLVFEEVVTNIMRYGFEPDQALGGVELTLSLAADGVNLEFDDTGRPFNPLEAAEPSLPSSLATAKVGGLGIMLVRKAARHLSYERRADHNVLHVCISLR